MPAQTSRASHKLVDAHRAPRGNEALKNQRLSSRDERAARLRDLVKNFMSDSFALLSKVRQDFLDKAKEEKILGCATWREYCGKVLGYSESHIRNMMAKSGDNPAKKFAAKNPHRKQLTDGKQNEILTRKELKTIKTALEIPQRDVLPAEVEAAFKTGYEKGHDSGFVEGQEAQFQYDEEHLQESEPLKPLNSAPTEMMKLAGFIVRRRTDGRVLYPSKLFLECGADALMLNLFHAQFFLEPDADAFKKILRAEKRRSEKGYTKYDDATKTHTPADPPFDAAAYEWVRVEANINLTSVSLG